MLLVCVLIVFIFLCGIAYIGCAVWGKPIVDVKKRKKTCDCMVTYFIGILLVISMMTLMIDIPDCISGRCLNGEAVVLTDMSNTSHRSWTKTFDLKFKSGEVVRVMTVFPRVNTGDVLHATVFPSTGFAFVQSPDYSGIGVTEVLIVVALLCCCSLWSARKCIRKKRKNSNLFCVSTKPTPGIAANRCCLSIIVIFIAIALSIWILERKNTAIWKPIIFCIFSVAAVAASVQQIIIYAKEKKQIKRNPVAKHSKRKQEAQELSLNNVLNRIRQENILEVTAVVDGKKVRFGACSDYSKEGDFFDKGYFIGEQLYEDYDEFRSELDNLFCSYTVLIKKVE